ncbi:hypothetical protein RRG08_006398 [Elysia crispata]|uniref:Uncharacterized protein n=1 Tax=Elysia crispata TaxID=231223 RepID=A0AAE0Y2B2_9GAST|nr:hypothetical protein RRG08_006398 [Elysia crispata]
MATTVRSDHYTPSPEHTFSSISHRPADGCALDLLHPFNERSEVRRNEKKWNTPVAVCNLGLARGKSNLERIANGFRRCFSTFKFVRGIYRRECFFHVS